MDAKVKPQFEEVSGWTVRIEVDGKVVERPVLRLGNRIYAGEFLSMLNPHGYGGKVWSALDLDIDQLQYNIDFNARRDRGHRH